MVSQCRILAVEHLVAFSMSIVAMKIVRAGLPPISVFV